MRKPIYKQVNICYNSSIRKVGKLWQKQLGHQTKNKLDF